MKPVLKIASAACLLALAAPAQSQILWDTLVDNTLNFYEDQDREIIIDVDGNGRASPGDVFIGYSRIDDRSIPLPGESTSNNLYGIFAIELDTITPTVGATETEYSMTFKSSTVAGLTLQDLTGNAAAAGQLVAVYEDVGANLITTSPGDVDGDGRLTMFDFIGKITSSTLDLLAGFEEGVDHFVTEAEVNNDLDPIANFLLLHGLTLAGGIPGGSIDFHAGLGITYTAQGLEDCPALPSSGTWCWGRLVQDNVEFPPTLHELTVQNGDISGASDLRFAGVNPYFSSAVVGGTGTWLGYNFYGLSTNADFGLYPVRIPEPNLVALMGLGLIGAGLARRRLKA